jgi:hypothetical protein
VSRVYFLSCARSFLIRCGVDVNASEQDLRLMLRASYVTGCFQEQRFGRSTAAVENLDFQVKAIDNTRCIRVIQDAIHVLDTVYRFGWIHHGTGPPHCWGQVTE